MHGSFFSLQERRRPKSKSSYNDVSKRVHPRGGMCERLKQAVLKTALPARVTGVRIPLPPPSSLQDRLRKRQTWRSSCRPGKTRLRRCRNIASTSPPSATDERDLTKRGTTVLQHRRCPSGYPRSVYHSAAQRVWAI